MNWTIHAMRDLNRADPLPELGPRVEPTPPPAPAPVSRGDGFLVHPDGTLSTEIEPPSGPPPAPAPADPDDDYPPVAAPIPAEAPPWPFPQGAMWREKGGPLFFRWDFVNDRAEVNSASDHLGWLPADVDWKRREFDNLALFEPIASAPAPLKVGDKVRLLFTSQMFGYHAGQVLVVSKIGDSGLFWTADDPDGSPLSTPEEEGHSWMRMNERREPDDPLPAQVQMPADFARLLSDNLPDLYMTDDFLPIEGGGTTLYRPRMRDTAHMAGADGEPPSPSHVHREHTTASGEGSLRGIPHAWPEVDRRTHPANTVRPLVERRGPRASRFNDLETT